MIIFHWLQRLHDLCVIYDVDRQLKNVDSATLGKKSCTQSIVYDLVYVYIINRDR